MSSVHVYHRSSNLRHNTMVMRPSPNTSKSHDEKNEETCHLPNWLKEGTNAKKMAPLYLETKFQKYNVFEPHFIFCGHVFVCLLPNWVVKVLN